MHRTPIGSIYHTPFNYLFAESIRYPQVLRYSWSSAFAITKPILLVVSLLDPSGKARIWPLMWTANQTVLDRIVVNIIDMMHQVNFAADSVFPESLLPDTPFPVMIPRLRDFGFLTAVSQPCFGKPAFYTSPPSGEIVIIFRQFPNTMNMVRQKNDSRQIERMLCFLLSNRLPQVFVSRGF